METNPRTFRGTWLRRAAILFLSVLFLLPLVFMVVGSLRTPGLPPPEGFEWLPEPLRWANYETVFSLVPLRDYLGSSLLVVAIAVPVTVLVASWAGFAIATSAPPARLRLIVISVAALMVPLSALWVPRAVLYRWLDIIDTPWSLIAPAAMATTPFYVLIFAVAYARIPKAMYEAAELEGLSPFAVWRRVAWPLARPAAFAVAVLAFVWHWSNFVDALLYISSSEQATLPLGLRALQTLEPTNYSLLLAASVMVTIPAVVAFLLAQRAFFIKALDVG